MCSNRRLGGVLIEMGGVRARIKVPKLAQNKFNNQQWLEAVMEGSGGWHRWGAMATNDDGGNGNGKGRCNGNATATVMDGTMATHRQQHQ
jgi:hypothetical protein